MEVHIVDGHRWVVERNEHGEIKIKDPSGVVKTYTVGAASLRVSFDGDRVVESFEKIIGG